MHGKIQSFSVQCTVAMHGHFASKYKAPQWLRASESNLWNLYFIVVPFFIFDYFSLYLHGIRSHSSYSVEPKVILGAPGLTTSFSGGHSLVSCRAYQQDLSNRLAKLDKVLEEAPPVVARVFGMTCNIITILLMLPKMWFLKQKYHYHETIYSYFKN
jgi:hypothetical protein